LGGVSCATYDIAALDSTGSQWWQIHLAPIADSCAVSLSRTDGLNSKHRHPPAH
jgi:hypothetical protein